MNGCDGWPPAEGIGSIASSRPSKESTIHGPPMMNGEFPFLNSSTTMSYVVSMSRIPAAPCSASHAA